MIFHPLSNLHTFLSSCPRGWFLLNGTLGSKSSAGCYHFGSVEKTQRASQEVCNARSGYLVEINNEVEHHFLSLKLNLHKSKVLSVMQCSLFGRTSSLTSIILIESKKIILKTSYTGPLSHAYALLMSNLIPTLDLLISSYELLLKIALHNSRSIQSRS